ncbi:AfsR/SARP family transcriptional regulator [Kribbella deserti]|uniref:BTAD domain-containing putative transcriptional regulator n=1 Tax=Kribbella deserti TaxID=1926257 RepID=A0ABV6QEV5_9ACTN
MEFGLLGPLRVRSSGHDIHISPGRQRTLLAVLALKANSVVSADELVERLWDTAPPAKAKAALHVQMARLRRALGEPDPIRTVPAGYCLAAAPGEVDVQRFESLVRDAGGTSELAVRSRYLAEALALWRGPALVDVPGESLQRDVVPALAESRAQALEQRVDVDLSLGRHAGLIAELRTLTSEHPLRERFWAQLMIALYRSEQQAEALSTYRTARQLLIDVLGVEPGPELRRLERDVLAGVPELRQSPPAVRLDSWDPQYQLPREVTGVVGFETFADDLADHLTREASVPIVAIHGGAGVGKSTLAVQVAHRTRQSFPDGQWFVRLEGAERGGRPPADVLGELLIASGLSGPMIPRGVAARAAMLRARLAGRRVLLLLDDAAGPEQIEDLIPGTEGSAVLTTSRRDLRGLSVRHGSYGLELPVLTASAGAALLTAVLGDGRTAAEPAAVTELVELCARLPLALRIAAANLGLHPHRSIADYVGELRGGDRLSRLQIAGDAAVRAAFEVSYRGLDPVAARTFRLLGLVPGPDFTAETASVLLEASVADAGRQLEVLAATSLIQHYRPGRYQFHDLLRLYAAEQANAAEGAAESAAAVRRLVAYQVARIDRAAALLYPNTRRLARPATDVPDFADHGEALAWLDAERAGLVAMARHVAVEGPTEQTWHLADALRGYFAARRHNDDWEALASTGLAAAEAAGSVDVLAAMHLSLGVLHSYRAEHPSAEAHYRQAIALRQAAGKNDENGPVYNNLGVLYTSQAMYGDAVEAFHQAGALDRDLCSPRGLANKLSNLATVLFYQGDLAAAVEQLREAERIRAAAGIPSTAQTTFTLGQCLHRLGDTSAAAEELARSLTLSQEIGEDLSVTYAHYGLAELRCSLGDLDQAADHATAALALAREMRSSAAEIDALNVSGTVQRLRGDQLQAIALHTHALDLSRQTGERRAGVQAQAGQAAALYESDQTAAAMDQAKAALETARRYGLRIAEATVLALLSRLHRVAGDRQAAASAARKAAELHRLTGYRPSSWEIAWLTDA